MMKPHPYREPPPPTDEIGRLRRRIRALERRWRIATSIRAWWRGFRAVDLVPWFVLGAVVIVGVMGIRHIDRDIDTRDACTVACARTSLASHGVYYGNECVCHDRRGVRSIARIRP